MNSYPVAIGNYDFSGFAKSCKISLAISWQDYFVDACEDLIESLFHRLPRLAPMIWIAKRKIESFITQKLGQGVFTS